MSTHIYKSLKPYKSIYKFSENSFSNTVVSRILVLFNRVLQKRIHKPLFGSPELYDLIKTPEGKFYTFDYEFGKGLKLRYRVLVGKSASIHSVDFYFKPYFDKFPSYTLNTQGVNLNQLLDLIASTIINREPAVETILFEGVTPLKEDKSFISTLANNLPIKASGLKDYLLSGIDSPKIDTFLPKAKGKDYDQVATMYNRWASKNKQKTFSSGAAIRSVIFQGMIAGGLKDGVTVEVKPGKRIPEKQLPTQLDIDIEKEMAKFKGTTDERFQEMYDYVEDVATGKSYSTIIIGDPGIGKTYGVEEVLKQNGFSVEEVDPQIEYLTDDEGNETPVRPTIESNKYILVKGKVTPTALYNMLYLYNNAIIVFDDSDDVLKKDPNLVKAATDDKPRRKITNSSAKTMKLDSFFPPSFLYTGRCIFVSNLYAEDIDSAIISRGNIIELVLTSDEMIERAKTLTPKIVQEIPGATSKMATEVLDFLLSISHLFGKLDLRTYGSAIKARVRNSPDWQNRVARSIITKAKSLGA